jgi:hypothetical protein
MWDVRSHAQLGVLVATVSLEVLAHRDGLLDKVVEVLGDGRGEAWDAASAIRSGGARRLAPSPTPP